MDDPRIISSELDKQFREEKADHEMLSELTAEKLLLSMAELVSTIDDETSTADLERIGCEGHWHQLTMLAGEAGRAIGRSDRARIVAFLNHCSESWARSSDQYESYGDAAQSKSCNQVSVAFGAAARCIEEGNE